MSFTLLVMPIITFIGVTGVVMLIGLVIMRKTNKVKVRMDRYLGDPKQAESVKRGEQKILKERRLKRRTTSTSNRRLETELEKAGLFLRSSEFILLSGFVSVLCITVGLVAQRGGLVFPFIFGVVGLCIPLIYIKILQGKRVAMFNSQIVDAFGLISNSLKAGYSFFQAMQYASTQMPSPIADEFARVVKEVNLGAETEDVLESMRKRVESDDLDLVITAVLIQRQVGGNLSEILDTIAETVRERIRIKQEIRTLTAQGRISGLVIAILPFGLGLLLFSMNPEYMSVLFENPLGQLMIVVAVVSEIIGALIIKRIVNIKV
jgi:tight adherence protein B